ncbi:hypothetical protein [Serratia quinivorans]|uniref:hypothetical protein n=1 Tax=Serratia quinivorans TaxID=137545 RepID=UPI003982CC06
MKLFGIGGCNHVNELNNKHVTNKKIKGMAKELKSVMNTANDRTTGPCIRAELKNDIHKVTLKILKALVVINDNRSTHNENKHTKMMQLANKAVGFKDSYDFKNRTVEPVVRDYERGAQRKFEKANGIDMGGMVR